MEGLNQWLGVGKVVCAKMAGGSAQDECSTGKRDGFESRVGLIEWLANTDTGTMQRQIERWIWVLRRVCEAG